MELKLNHLVLFRNDKKAQRAMKQPDWIGTINIDGVVRDIVIWNVKSNKGMPYLMGKNAPQKNAEPKKPRTKKLPEYKQQKLGKEEDLSFL